MGAKNKVKAKITLNCATNIFIWQNIKIVAKKPYRPYRY